ncbi:hypothetical protein F4809DRAFT_361227 [Biscogniauxia mediterranea]|nr:hypothetical protein F4809DRAFT_361227 [Biscogniauxia mediterranea]
MGHTCRFSNPPDVFADSMSNNGLYAENRFYVVLGFLTTLSRDRDPSGGRGQIFIYFLLFNLPPNALALHGYPPPDIHIRHALAVSFHYMLARCLPEGITDDHRGLVHDNSAYLLIGVAWPPNVLFRPTSLFQRYLDATLAIVQCPPA